MLFILESLVKVNDLKVSVTAEKDIIHSHCEITGVLLILRRVGCAYIHLHSLFWHQFPDRFLPFFSQIQMWNKPKSVPKAADENLV